jgi:hypothetical protein
MKLSKELYEHLEAVSREVEGWPKWKRSIDLRDLKKMTEPDCEFCKDGDVPTHGRHYIFDTAVTATHSHTCTRNKRLCK